MSVFVLVHGAFHGAWSWSLVVQDLEEMGHQSVTMDLPIDDPSAEWHDHVRAVMDVARPDPTRSLSDTPVPDAFCRCCSNVDPSHAPSTCVQASRRPCRISRVVLISCRCWPVRGLLWNATSSVGMSAPANVRTRSTTRTAHRIFATGRSRSYAPDPRWTTHSFEIGRRLRATTSPVGTIERSTSNGCVPHHARCSASRRSSSRAGMRPSCRARGTSRRCCPVY